MTGSSAKAGTHVVMGRIGAPWGIKGWLKLYSFTQPSENLLNYRVFQVEQGICLQDVEFDEIKPHGAGFVGHIKGCELREQCGAYTGRELLVPKDSLPALDSGYYWYQLEGLKVINLQGEVLGTVHHLLETGANDVLVVQGDEHSLDRQERLLPWVEDRVIKSVDFAKGIIEVDWGADWGLD